jgi:hypothetical protein
VPREKNWSPPCLSVLCQIMTVYGVGEEECYLLQNITTPRRWGAQVPEMNWSIIFLMFSSWSWEIGFNLRGINHRSPISIGAHNKSSIK